MDLTERVVIVTGASSGIGAATARAFAAAKATVVLAARRAEHLDALCAEIAREGGQALAVPTDVSQPVDIERLVEQTIAHFGRIDILVNNAGIGNHTRLVDVSNSVMERLIAVNLLAPVRCAQAVVPYMRAAGDGVIVNIGSVAGEVGAPGIYAVTKVGVRAATNALRRELRDDHIAVVLVEPGLVRTPMTDGVNMPMIDAEVIARKILQAVHHPRRKLIVPWYYGFFAFFIKAFPALADRVLTSEAVVESYKTNNVL